MDAQTEREVARVESDELGLFIFEDIPAGRYIFDLADAPRWSFPTVRDALPGYERTVTGAGRGLHLIMAVARFGSLIFQLIHITQPLWCLAKLRRVMLSRQESS